jgi:hypothetical protein
VSLWFVTPAWQRYELSAVCFDQRVDVIRALAAAGVEARCVVIADDENLDLARERGLDALEAPNILSDKFNAGMEYAGFHGAEWIVPIGSDSWIDPAYFLPLPSSQVSRTSPLYCAVTADRLAELRVDNGKGGAGPYVLHRSRLAPVGFRPATPGLMRRVDSSTVRGLAGSPEWRPRNVHAFQYIGFRGTPHITGYDELWERWGIREHDDPWAVLAEHYPAELVERASRALAAAVPA